VKLLMIDNYDSFTYNLVQYLGELGAGVDVVRNDVETVDALRADHVGAYGYSRPTTPNIDRLVAEGVAFTHAFCQSTVCTPSRASFLTGRYPRTTRCRQNGQTIPPSERLISRIFADAGYTCGLAGKQHLSSCSDGKVEIRHDDGYSVFEWSHHPQPDWPENAYTQWLASQGKTWEELYQGPATPYIKHGVPAEFHQTTWCAERAADFAIANRGRPWPLAIAEPVSVTTRVHGARRPQPGPA